MKKKPVKAFWKEELWYPNLSNEGKCIADLIFKYHDYFSQKDAKYRRVVRVYKVVILSLAMFGTIIFGLKNLIKQDTQVVIGLFVSALITFVTAVSSYFNYEEYWMRNIKIHIRLNILRDHFRLDAESNKMDASRVKYYMKELDKIQQDNIYYWERNINK